MTSTAHQQTALDPHRLVDLARSYATPLYIYDAARIAHTADRMRDAMAPLTPGFHFFEFANRNRSVLELVRDLGFGLTVARPAGVRRALELGFPVESIQCSGFGLSAGELREICATGVSVNAATISELRHLLAARPSRPFGVRLDFTSDNRDKRGIPPTELLAALPGHRLPVNGLHTYIGTNVVDAGEHLVALRRLATLLDALPAPVARGIEYINVGGGFGYDYRNRSTFDWHAYGRTVRSIMLDLRRDTGRDLALKLEVGRSLVVDSGYLVARVLHAYEKNARRYVVVDTNLSQFGRPARYGFHTDFYPYLDDGYHRMALLSPDSTYLDGAAVEVAVVGNSHYSKDWFGFTTVRKWAPAELTGAYVVIFDTGSYCESMSDHWADEPRPATVLVDHDSARLIARRETVDELVFPLRERENAQTGSGRTR